MKLPLFVNVQRHGIYYGRTIKVLPRYVPFCRRDVARPRDRWTGQ